MKNLLKSVLGIGLAASLALSASTASADGFYIGVGAYKANIDSELLDANLDDEDIVPAAFIGYQLLDVGVLMLSAELGYYDLGGYSKSGDSVEATAISLAGVAYLPIGPFFELYAKVGVASISSKTDIDGIKDDFNGNDSFAGAGFAFDIFDTVDIYAEYLRFNTKVDSELIGVGVRLDF